MIIGFDYKFKGFLENKKGMHQVHAFKIYLFSFLANIAVSLKECVYRYCCEAENDDSYEDLTDAKESLLPVLVAEADALE